MTMLNRRYYDSLCEGAIEKTQTVLSVYKCTCISKAIFDFFFRWTNREYRSRTSRYECSRYSRRWVSHPFDALNNIGGPLSGSNLPACSSRLSLTQSREKGRRTITADHGRSLKRMSITVVSRNVCAKLLLPRPAVPAGRCVTSAVTVNQLLRSGGVWMRHKEPGNDQRFDRCGIRSHRDARRSYNFLFLFLLKTARIRFKS